MVFNMDSDEFSEQLWNNLMKNIDTTRKGRGYIIDRVIQMEILLNQIISSFFSDDKEKYKNFNELILNKEFFTLHQKIKIFSELKLHKDKKFDKKFEGLTERLFEVNKIRNKVAHLNDNPYNPGFNVKIKDKTKRVQLNDKFLKEFEEFMQEIYKSLINIQVESGLAKNFHKHD